VQLGLVGMPNVGKTTLFSALSRVEAEVSNYPFCTIDRNQAVVPVPDPRLETLADIFGQEKRTPTTIEFIDIAGLVRGASEGQGLGNQFLGHIRQVDAIAHVLRCFEQADVAHVESTVDPLRDLELVEVELALADLATVERRMKRTGERRHQAPEEYEAENEVLAQLAEGLRRGEPVRRAELPDEAQPLVRELFLLTAKPVLWIANVAEADLAGGSPLADQVRARAEAQGIPCLTVCAKLEADLADLPEEEAAEFIEELELPASGLDQVIEESYRLLDLITFFTAVGAEARAWTLRRGGTAEEAAGKIHTDMAKGFIKAEVGAFDELAKAGSWQALKDAGRVRLHGRDYVVQDGDVLIIRFSS